MRDFFSDALSEVPTINDRQDSTSSSDWRLASGPEVPAERAADLKEPFQTAWYLSLQMTPDEVGQLLHLSRATVYRHLKTAEIEGLLQTEPRCALPTGSGASELMASVLMKDKGEEVRAAFPREIAPAEVLVVPTGGLAEHAPPDRVIAERVSRTAARRLAVAMLVDTRTVGIAYGHHCRYLSAALPGGITQRLPREAAKRCQFFPMVGSLGATEVAEDLKLPEASAESNAIRATHNMETYGVEPSDENETKLKRPPQITQPCVIADEVAGDRDLLKAAWRILSMDASIQTIFGRTWCDRHREGSDMRVPDGEGGLLHRAHCLVTGIGDLEQSRMLALTELYPLLGELARQAGACADICGYMFCGRDDYEQNRDNLAKVNRRIVAPTLEDYIQATQRARLRSEGLGTFVIASGGGEPEFSQAKARAIAAAISHGAINILCIDEMIAKALVSQRQA